MDRRKQHRCDYFLPQDLIVAEILPRLFTTAAARFRCVCKSWRRLLSDPKFIHRQLIYGDDGNSDEPIVMITRLDLQDKSRLHYSLLSYDKLLPKSTPYHDHEGLRYLYVPGLENYSTEQRRQCVQEIIGCCNGLFCIVDRSLWDASAKIILWNPSTSETKLLPDSHYGAKYINSGFGFDSSTKDYKVLTIFQDVFTDRLSVEVYSTRNGSWRRVNGAKDEDDLKKFYLCPKHNKSSSPGKIYWYSINYNYITCFDFREERFINQVFPAGILERVGDVGEVHLAATSKEDSMMAVFRDKNDNFEIWGLLRYQSVESWTKLVTCDASRILGSVGKRGRVIGVSGNGEHIIVKANSELLKVDFENETVRGDNGIRALSKMSRPNIDEYRFMVYNYVPSRVSIAGLLLYGRNIIQDSDYRF